MQCTHELISKASIALYDRNTSKGDTLNLAMWQHLYEYLKYFGVAGVDAYVNDLNRRTRQKVAEINSRRVRGEAKMALSDVCLQPFVERLNTLKLLKPLPGTEAIIKQVVKAHLIDFDSLEAAIEFNKSSAEMRAQLLALLE